MSQRVPVGVMLQRKAHNVNKDDTSDADRSDHRERVAWAERAIEKGGMGRESHGEAVSLAARGHSLITSQRKE